MSKPPDTETRVMPSARPATEAELAEWNALTREEQVQRYRESLQHPDCQRISKSTVADVVAVARERVAARRRG